MHLAKPNLVALIPVTLLVLSALPVARPAAAWDGAIVSGRLLQDMDGNGQVSDADVGYETLFSLVLSPYADGRPGASLFANVDGDFVFRFACPPTSNYDLVISWGPGFITPEAHIDASLDIQRPSDGRLIITLPPQRIAAGDFQDLVFLVNPFNPGDPFPYPVVTGPGPYPTHGAAAIAGDCTALPATPTAESKAAADANLPDTGTGPASSAAPWPAAALASLAAAGAIGLAGALSRARTNGGARGVGK